MVALFALVSLSGVPVDAAFERDWAAAQVVPAPAAHELLIYRRLVLGLCGTVPSLEELRAFEADARADRLERALDRLLDDGRFHRSFAERLARVFVGTQRGAFLVYRRDRFVDWLETELRRNTPYDQLVRSMVTARGVWTGSPATNFVTSAVVDGTVDADLLASRTARAALGLRLDCAQCHDHPFADWSQAQFKGLAGFYAGLEVGGLGVVQREATGAAPYGTAWVPQTGEPRERLAAWLTDPHNVRFSRAAVNRVWGVLAGRPLVEPGDDVPLNAGGEALAALANGFVEHGHDLRWLVRTIARSKAYRLSSELPATADRPALEKVWAVFALSPLRPEQLAGALLQAASVRTVDLDSHLAVRVLRVLRETEFVEAYGDSVDDALAAKNATVSQALLRMNGELPHELLGANPFSAVGRIAALARSDADALDAIFLSFFSRRPEAHEREALEPMLAVERGRGAEDVAWALFNSPELLWNH
ncbi:MAG: DUF1549 domain-containing protein [Myxococcaceae bacterium]|nr:DUF1549 domain-containing protein [Myxococcaceae bacterium]